MSGCATLYVFMGAQPPKVEIKGDFNPVPRSISGKMKD
ncbi:hypothetical protein PEL8287_00111 [Roseovarius litorisediminis]|uniref:Uncharacterized protein n=1 Tax=Roseovarius litorisediminis TaxID=1312363 RepID=A0A1Y5R5R3_9RHOB|nr:hypothetical protein PEL8287_00111 [Roseovarius litorisediminis]